ncbi:ankyrin repeat-containing domain protein [Hypoxylon argillaceum]|nr:ankyrin repeat-containing domain protein [Hypoxylon argillaceum]
MDLKQLQGLPDGQVKAHLLCRERMGHRLSTAATDELKQIEMREAARLLEKRTLLEAPFAHLPPLPPALPEYFDRTTEFGPSDRDFFTWCIEGKTDAVEGYIGAQEGRASRTLLQRGLESACEGGRVQVARYLLQKGAFLHGYAIERACHRCDLALFEAFIEHGWHPNQQVPSIQGHFGVALPHCTQDLQTVQFLLVHGADPNLGAFDGRKIAGLGSTPPMDRNSGRALNTAAYRGNIAVINLLLEHGAVLEWSTPLHQMLHAKESWQENRPAFVHLLHLGADPNRNIHFSHGNQWEMGRPLHWAIRTHNWDAVELLLESGADPEINNISAYLIALRESEETKDKVKEIIRRTSLKSKAS